MTSLAPLQNYTHVRGAAAFLLSQSVALAGGLVVQMVAARRMASEDYGRFAVALTISLFATNLLGGVLPRAFAQHLSRNPTSLSSVIISMLQWHVPACLAFSVFLWGTRRQLASAFADAELVTLIPLVALLVFVQCGFLEPAWQILNGLRRHALQANLMASHSLLRCVGVSLAIRQQPSAAAGIAGVAMAAVLSAVMVATLVRTLDHEGRGGPTGDRLSARVAWNWVRLASPVDLINYVTVACGLWMVKSSVAEPGLIAGYAVCFALAQANLPLFKSFSRGFFASFAAIAGAPLEEKRLLSSVSRMMLAAGILEIAMVLVVGTSFVEWFSDMSVSPESLTSLLAFGGVAFGACFVLSDLLAAAGRLRLRLVCAAIQGIIGVGASFVLVPRFGVAGAGLVFSGIGAVALTIHASACWFAFGSWEFFVTFCRCSVSGGVATGIGWTLQATSDSIGNVLVGVSVTITFCVVMVLLREVGAMEARESIRSLVALVCPSEKVERNSENP